MIGAGRRRPTGKCPAALELAVVVFPLGAWGDRFNSIPMFHQRALRNAEEVIERRMDSTERAFTDRKYETPLCEQAMNPIIFYRNALVRCGFQC